MSIKKKIWLVEIKNFCFFSLSNIFFHLQEVAQVISRIQQISFVGMIFLCGLEPAVLKLQKSENGESEYVSVVETSNQNLPDSPPDHVSFWVSPKMNKTLFGSFSKICLILERHRDCGGQLQWRRRWDQHKGSKINCHSGVWWWWPSSGH